MKDKTIAIGFSIIIISVFTISIILKDNDLSLIERRKLTTIKQVTTNFFDKNRDIVKV